MLGKDLIVIFRFPNFNFLSTYLIPFQADLSKIPTILIEQAICLKRFNKLMFDYHKQMEEVLKKFGAGKV